jgi:hypothetical protein
MVVHGGLRPTDEVQVPHGENGARQLGTARVESTALALS